MAGRGCGRSGSLVRPRGSTKRAENELELEKVPVKNQSSAVYHSMNQEIEIYMMSSQLRYTLKHIQRES